MKPVQNYIRTYTGKKVRPLHMREKDICIEDVAHALSNICRYNGHCLRFYSVAQHSMIVAMFLVDPKDMAWGLLHDAAEAYLCDIPSPVKHAPEMAAYREAEDRVLQVVAKKYGLPWPMPQAVHDADRAVLSTEMVSFGRGIRKDMIGKPLPHIRIQRCFLPELAEERFLKIARTILK